MPGITGNLSYASSRFGGIGGLSAISNIPIVIQNTSTNVGIGVLTDILGNYSVVNIPAGVYRIVEAYGFVSAVTSPANFLTATTIANPTPKDPPLSAITVTLPNTNQVDSLSPNTLFATIVATTITGQNFVDSSLRNTPLTLPAGVVLGSNILTFAGNGIWGTLPNGTPVNTIPPTYPYTISMSSSLLIYTNNNNTGSPVGIGGANRFIMNNIAIYGWFCAPNHTTFDETSSYMIVNGGDPNAILFQQTMNVTQNTFYLASSWLIMVTNAPGTCLIGFRVLAQDGVTQLFYGQTSNIIYSQWGQIGQIFNTGNNSQVTVQVLSQGTAVGGNDFALDDVSLQGVSFNANVNLVKSVDKPIATLGTTLTYTSVLTTNINLFNLIFQDTLPVGSSFNPGTVKINATTFAGFNPNVGFTLPAMSSGAIATITFDATVVSIPSGGILNNTSNTTYSSAIIAGNTITGNIISNTVPTTVQYAKLDTIKRVDKSYSTVGDILNYTITIANNGNVSAGNIILKDTIPNGTSFVSGQNPSPPGISISTIPSGGISTVTFSVLVNTIPSPNPIPNSANISYVYLVNPSLGTTPSSSSNTNTVNTYVNLATLSSSKFVDYLYADVGTTITYSIIIRNTGNTTANSIVFIDTIPNGVSFVPNSLNQDGVVIPNSPNPPGTTLPNAVFPGATSTVTFKVIVITIPSPNPIPNSATGNYNYTIDPTTTPNRLGSDGFNTNIVFTTVSNANIGAIKSVDRSFASCGYILTYTITISNFGNVTAMNLSFIDTVPNGTSFVPNSLSVNGNIIPGGNPSLGVTIPDIGLLGISTVSFKVQAICT